MNIHISGSIIHGQNEDICLEMSEEETHSGHTAAGACLLREEDHDGGQVTFYCKVRSF